MNIFRPLLLVFVIIILTTAGCIGPEQPGDTQYPMTEVTMSPGSGEESSVLIRISFDEQEVIAELYDNAAANDLRSMLPLTLIFRDCNGAEKIAYPPETLDTENAPKGYDPEAGDVALYAPWGNIAVFYRDSPYASGLVPLGHVVSGLKSLAAVSGEFSATIDVLE